MYAKQALNICQICRFRLVAAEGVTLSQDIFTNEHINRQCSVDVTTAVYTTIPCQWLNGR